MYIYNMYRYIYIYIYIYIYCEGVGHGTLFCADEGTNPETAAVHRLRYYALI